MKKAIILLLFSFLNICFSSAQDTLRNPCRDKTHEDIQKTIAQYRQLLLQQPGNQKLHYELGMCYWKLHDPTTALRYFDTVISLNPHYGAVFSNRGLCKYFLKDTIGACEDFKKCIEYDKDYDNEIGSKSLSQYIKEHCK